jgi:carboxypeptidase family protein/tetratricopeptide repeat protein
MALSKFALAAAMAACVAAPAAAQTNRIGGVVRDETGATIRGAIVRAETGGTNTSAAPVTLTTATDDRGRFVFVVTRSGEWRLTFEAPGFEAQTIPLGVRLGGAAPNLDVKLDRRESPEAFGALAGVDSKSLSAQLAAAAALYDDGRHDQAIAAYREIKERAPALSLVNVQIGNSYLAKKSYGDAEAAYQEALKSDPLDSNALYAMGTLREAQGNAAEAQSWYQKASAADAIWTRPLMKLAELARASGDRATASKLLARVIEIDAASEDGQQASALLK